MPGTVRDYVNSAVLSGLETIGISDHTPLPDGRWQDVRMTMSELSSYYADIDASRSDAIAVLTALECEDFPEYHSFYQNELFPRTDYLIGGNHYFRMNGEIRGIYMDEGSLDGAALAAYTEHVVAAIASGLYAFIAHPDLFGYSYPRWDEHARTAAREIARAAKSYNVPLEINGYGMRKRKVQTPEGERCPYPWEPFWETAGDIGVQVIVNSDAHRPEDVAAGIVEGKAIAHRFGLSVVDTLPVRTR